MATIGKQTKMIGGPNANNARNGAGCFVRLKNGAIMYAYNEFLGQGWDDHHPIRISCYYSYDEGETWTDKRVILEKPDDAKNIAIISLARMGDGTLGMLYSFRRMDTPAEEIAGTITHLFVRSQDEGLTWSKPVDCMPVRMDNYYAIANDRLIRLKSGRWIYAVSRHSVFEENIQFAPAVVCFFCSDDDGFTWKKLPAEIGGSLPGDVDGWQEPGLYEMEDGTLWCYARSGLGWQFKSFSYDGGTNWSPMMPDYRYSAPPSPMIVKPVGKWTVSVFNPVPRRVNETQSRLMGRTPLVCAISEDDGKTIHRLYNLEDDPNNAYCYPTVFDAGGYFLVSYDHSNGTLDCHNSVKIHKVTYDEIQNDKGRIL